MLSRSQKWSKHPKNATKRSAIIRRSFLGKKNLGPKIENFDLFLGGICTFPGLQNLQKCISWPIISYTPCHMSQQLPHKISGAIYPVSFWVTGQKLHFRVILGLTDPKWPKWPKMAKMAKIVFTMDTEKIWKSQFWPKPFYTLLNTPLMSVWTKY